MTCTVSDPSPCASPLVRRSAMDADPVEPAGAGAFSRPAPSADGDGPALDDQIEVKAEPVLGQERFRDRLQVAGPFPRLVDGLERAWNVSAGQLDREDVRDLRVDIVQGRVGCVMCFTLGRPSARRRRSPTFTSTPDRPRYGRLRPTIRTCRTSLWAACWGITAVVWPTPFGSKKVPSWPKWSGGSRRRSRSRRWASGGSPFRARSIRSWSRTRMKPSPETAARMDEHATSLTPSSLLTSSGKARVNFLRCPYYIGGSRRLPSPPPRPGHRELGLPVEGCGGQDQSNQHGELHHHQGLAGRGRARGLHQVALQHGRRPEAGQHKGRVDGGEQADHQRGDEPTGSVGSCTWFCASI